MSSANQDEGQLQGHVDEVVRTSVEEILNAMPEAEADELSGPTLQAVAERRPRARASLAEARDQGREGDVAGAEAAVLPLREGDYRAIPPPGAPVEEAPGGYVSRRR